MRGQTIVRWGGQRGGEQIQIFNCLTVRFEQEAEFEELGSGNVLGQKFTVEVIGYVHNDVTMADAVRIEPFVGGATATEQCVYLRTLAMKQRQRFEMEVGADTNGNGGSILLEADPFVGNDAANLTHKDINNGPRCTNFDIEHLTATVMRVSATFEIMKAECSGFGANRTNNSGVLSHVWRVEDSVSQNFFTTRTFAGVLRLASSVGYNPHSFRSLVIPPLQPGMRRDSMKFVAHENGLELSYVITDQEVAFAPPAPATSWNFKHTESVGMGKLIFGEISVLLRGDRHADRRKLLTIAAGIVEARLLTFEGQKDADGVILNNVIEMYSVTEEMGDSENDNAISINARVQRPFTVGALGGVLNFNFGFPPEQLRPADPPIELIDWDSRNSRGNWTTGAGANFLTGTSLESHGPVSAVTAFSTFLQTSCSGEHSIRSGQEAEELNIRKQKPPKIEAYTTNVPSYLSRGRSHTSKGHRQAPYTVFQGQSTYKTNQHTVQMPIAAWPVGTSGLDLLSRSSEFISLAPPTCERIYRVKATRVGSEPELPPGESFIEAGIAFVFKHKGNIFYNKNYRPDGTPEYSVDAEYVWGMSRAPRNSERLLIGVNPFDVSGRQLTSVASTNSPNMA